MKKYLVLFISVLFMSLLTSCSDTTVYSENPDSSNLGISLMAKNVTPTGMTLVITQSGGTSTGTLEYGADYELKKWNNETWEAVPDIVKGFINWAAIAYRLPMGQCTELEINWEYLYGSLPEGKYLFMKEFMDFRSSGDYDTAVHSVIFEVK